MRLPVCKSNHLNGYKGIIFDFFLIATKKSITIVLFTKSFLYFRLLSKSCNTVTVTLETKKIVYGNCYLLFVIWNAKTFLETVNCNAWTRNGGKIKRVTIRGIRVRFMETWYAAFIKEKLVPISMTATIEALKWGLPWNNGLDWYQNI